MDFNSVLKHLSGEGKENRIFYSEPEIQAQRDVVAKLQQSGMSQMVVEAQERRLAEMEAKKQQPVDKAEIAKNLDFLNPQASLSANPDMRPQFPDVNSVPSSYDVAVSDTTVPMNGRFADLPMPEQTPPLRMVPAAPLPLVPEAQSPAVAPVGPGKSTPASPAPAPNTEGKPDLLAMAQPSPDEDAAKRAAFAKDEKRKRLMQIFPQLLAGAGDVITAHGAPYGTKQTDALDKVVKIGKDDEKLRKDEFEKSLLTDPKSGMSKVAQQAAARLLGKKPEELASLSLAQIDKAFPIWKEALNNEQARELKQLQIQAMKEAREDRKAVASERQAEKKTHDQERQIQQMRQNLTGSDAFKSMQKIDYAGKLIEDSLKDPSAYGDLATMFSFMKALDDTSVVRESEQGRFIAAASVPQATLNTINSWINGQYIQPSQRKEVAEFVNKMRKHKKEAFLQYNKPTIAQAERLGYPLSNIDPIFENEPAPAASGEKTTAIRKDPKTGKRYEVDLDTKQVLREVP